MTVPKPGDTVTGRVTRIQRDKATLDILVLGDERLRNSFQGVVHKSDVQPLETDKVRAALPHARAGARLCHAM